MSSYSCSRPFQWRTFCSELDKYRSSQTAFFLRPKRRTSLRQFLVRRLKGKFVTTVQHRYFFSAKSPNLFLFVCLFLLLLLLLDMLFQNFASMVPLFLSLGLRHLFTENRKIAGFLFVCLFFYYWPSFFLKKSLPFSFFALVWSFPSVLTVDMCAECDPHARCINGKCFCRRGYTGDGYTCKKGKWSSVNQGSVSRKSP